MHNYSISITPTQGTGPYNIEWADLNAPNDIPAGTYTVTITDALGCEQTLDIEVGACPPDLALEADVMGVSEAGASDGSATINTGDGEGPYIYEWNTGDSTATVNNLPEGDYTVTVTDVNGCSDVLTITIGIFISTNELHEQFANILLAPNPTSGLTELTVELNETAEVVVQVLDVVGQVIYESPRERFVEKKYQLDLSEKAGGMYFVRVSADNKSSIVKLIKAE